MFILFLLNYVYNILCLYYFNYVYTLSTVLLNYLYTIFVKFFLYERLLIHAGGVIILTQSQTPLM